MIHFSLKSALGWLERVVRGEGNIEEKDAALIGRVPGTHNHSLPLKHVVVVDWTSRDGLRAVLLQVRQLLSQTLLGHYCSD